MVLDREDGEEKAQERLSYRQGSTIENNREMANRKDEKEVAQGRVSHRQGSTIENNREMANRKDEKEVAQGRVSHRQGSTTKDNTEEEALKKYRGISVKEDNQLIPNRKKRETDLITTLQCQKISDPQILKKFQVIQEP